MREIYDKDFYLQQYQDSLNSANQIIPIIKTLFPQIKKIVDVGCGVGTWLEAWKKSDDKIQVLGLDGNDIAKNFTFLNHDEYKRVDLTSNASKILDLINCRGGV